MATCYNKNTAAYRALQNEFTSPLVVDSIIAKWQKLNNSETIPTVADATEYMNDQKALFNLNKREYSNALLANISRQKIMSQWNGSYYINNTNRVTKQLDRNVLVNNRIKLLKYLDFWNVPQSLINIEPTSTGKTYRVSINQKLLTKTDILPETNNKDNTRILDIIQHMNSMFPNISIDVVSLKQAEEYYESLPEWQKSKVPFSKVNSYYVNGQAVLIKNKVTTETAVEEVLHPFIETIHQENKGLYNGLLTEARIMFPDLTQQIEDTYTERRGFNQTTRDLELVTQALSRHFNKEYEGQPTQKWYQKLVELLKFFSNILENFYNFMSSSNLVVSTDLLRPTSTLSDLAKVLNTGNLQFDFSNQSVVNNKVRFSLTPEKSKKVAEYMGKATTSVQRDTIEQLFHAATKSNENIASFAVSSKLTNSNTPLVIHIKDPHSYVDIESGEAYESTTKKIKGELNDPNNDFEFNRELGNDFDNIAEVLALNLTDKEFPIMKVLDTEQVEVAVSMITTALDYYRKQGAVIIPQVVVADAASNTAGSIDLLAVHDDGTLQVIDLKTSKNSTKDPRYFGRGSGFTNKMKGLYEVNKGSVFYNPDKAFYMSTAMQHSMQVNIYRRMLTNMGYEVRDESETFHLLVGVEGKGKNQKFTGSVKLESPITHLASQNLTYVNEIIPVNVDSETKDRLKESTEEAGIISNDGIKLTEQEAKPDTDVLNFETYEALDTTVRKFEVKAVERSEAILLMKSKIKQTNEDKRLLVVLDNMSGLINAALVKGTADVAYEELVAMSIEEIDAFTTYALDPKNFNKFEYIDRVLSFENFAKTFSGLNNVGKGNENIQLNQRQFALKDKLSRKLSDILGDNAAQTQGIISTSIQNYIRTFVKNNSNRNFSEGDLTDLLNSAEDIGMFGMSTGDMSTSSDTMLALMDKLYKNQLQKSLDIIDNRNDHVRRLIAKGEALSPRGKIDYSFMLQFDKDNSFSGRYVKEIGYQYYSKRADLYKGTKNDVGDALEYIYKDNLDDYDQTEIKHNKKLYKAKSRIGDFLKAEKVVNGEYVDGDYHRYTKEYTDARALVMTWVKSSDKFGYWEKRGDVSNNTYTKFNNKYHKSSPFTQVNRDGNGEMNGSVKQPIVGNRFPKSKYVEKRGVSSVETGSENMRDAKYNKIMNPSVESSLEQWQKEFYMMWQKFYEKDLLEKIPPAQNAQMIGKTPIIMDNTLKHAAKSGPLVAKLWGRTTRGFKDFWTESMQTQSVQTDEHGQLINTLPLFYVGNPRTDEALTNIETKIQDLYKAYQSPENKLTEKEYNLYKADLEGQRMRIQSQPTKDQLSTDMGDNLLRFSAMAENYEVMGEIQNTLTSMMKVLEKRTYTPSGVSKLVTNVKGKLTKVSSTTEDLYNSNIVARAKKWMKMVYYDNDQKTRGLADKISESLISASSLTYIGFNIWGNINNYAVGRINNTIEAIGGRFFDGDAYIRAETEFNTRAVPGFFKNIGKNASGITRNIPGSKYEALANLYRMMDDASDIRENNKSKGKEGGWEKAKTLAYLVQDGAEYNVQTKIGIAILMSKLVRDKSGNEMSLYDAYQFNDVTGEISLKEGFDQLVNNKNGELAADDVIVSDFTDNSRYEIRNYIREVNKQTHGNYAHVDRMVIQSHWLGKLGAQFHKWVAPAIKARYRGEYYDENLGWMEGRYISSAKFFLYFFKNMKDIGSITKNFAEKYDSEDKGKGANKIAGLWRTGAEMMMLMSSFAMAALLESLFDDDDDKSQTTKRLENALIYQMNRQARELLFFIPGFGVKEVFMMAKSPIAVTRMLGEIGEAAWQTMWFPGAWGWDKLIDDDYNVREDKTYYYQRGSRKGQAKIGKEWTDIVPILYAINRFRAYDTQKDFFVK